MATKRYWVGMPNVHSKLRPIKYDKLPMKNEYSKFERQFREKNEALAKFNHEFWSEHNQRYDLERIRFLEQRTINVKNIDMNQVENFDDKILAEFYKKFLDDNWQRHWDYNW
uniref:Uncharacterized protein n=1 Tax=Romanomermis culicivorax TaxID=13658 RepID=A0A915JX03_ROMCU